MRSVVILHCWVQIVMKHSEINAAIEKGFNELKLYSDLGLPWAVKTEPFDLEGFTEFQMDTPSID